jgi:hypothetical protein
MLVEAVPHELTIENITQLGMGRNVENDQVEVFVESNVSEEGSISDSESSMQDLQYDIMKSKTGPAWPS